MSSEDRSIVVLAVVLMVVVTVLAFCVRPYPVRADCEYYPPNPPHEPTGVKGCEIYGDGIASMWGGPGVARNDCVYPWTDCATIRITSLETGISVERTPTMYCDCYTGTADQRIVDLPPDVVATLGLDPARGLWEVRIEPVVASPLLDAEQPTGSLLPDTAMAP